MNDDIVIDVYPLPLTAGFWSRFQQLQSIAEGLAPPLRMGDPESDAVEWLQGALRLTATVKPGTFENVGLPQTGHFGMLTRLAVRRFQRSRRLRVDGVAGPETLKALDRELILLSRFLGENSHPASEPAEAA